MTIPWTSPDAEAKLLKNQGVPQDPSATEIRDEIVKYLRFLPHVAEPSLGRVREIQEEIKKGTYLNREIVEETAARLALRFLRKE